MRLDRDGREPVTLQWVAVEHLDLAEGPAGIQTRRNGVRAGESFWQEPLLQIYSRPSVQQVAVYLTPGQSRPVADNFADGFYNVVGRSFKHLHEYLSVFRLIRPNNRQTRRTSNSSSPRQPIKFKLRACKHYESGAQHRHEEYAEPVEIFRGLWIARNCVVGRCVPSDEVLEW